jgi:hypothetical protein
MLLSTICTHSLCSLHLALWLYLCAIWVCCSLGTHSIQADHTFGTSHLSTPKHYLHHVRKTEESMSHRSVTIYNLEDMLPIPKEKGRVFFCLVGVGVSNENKNIWTWTRTSIKKTSIDFFNVTRGLLPHLYIYWCSPKSARFMFYKRWNNNSKTPKHQDEKWQNHKYTNEMQTLPHQCTGAIPWCL